MTPRNRNKFLARIEALEKAVANLCPGPENRRLWNLTCESLAHSRTYLASRPQTPDVVQQIEETEAKEKRLQALDPNTMGRRTLERIVDRSTLNVAEQFLPMWKAKMKRFPDLFQGSRAPRS